MSAQYLIGYRDSDRRIRYYAGVSGLTGRAVCCPKKEAPRFDSDTVGVILRQLPAIDNRGWQMVEDRPRCRFG